MKIAIMQPYFCPYLGYFQLVNAVDKFVFYDNVAYIKGGWINRNKITSNGKEFLFTIPLVAASSYKLIKDTEVNWHVKDVDKLMKNIASSYKKAPYYGAVMQVLEQIISDEPATIGLLAGRSVKAFSDYLGLQTKFSYSSEGNYTKTDNRVENLINIIKAEQADVYINPIGGMELYNKVEFSQYDVSLFFLKGKPSLSIIDVCMNNSVKNIISLINDFSLL